MRTVYTYIIVTPHLVQPIKGSYPHIIYISHISALPTNYCMVQYIALYLFFTTL